MALETGTFISDLVPTNPVGSDPLAFADDHLRLVKSTIKNSFPNITGAVTKTHTQLNNTLDKTGDTMTGALVLAGAPSADLQAATKAYVDAAITATRQNAYPVGSVYVNASVATNPATLLGFGTWAAFGAGRVPVGFDSTNPLFDTAEETGGSANAVVVSHTHTGTTSVNGAHVHTMVFDHNQYDHGITGNVGDNGGLNPTRTAGSMSTEGNHTHTFTTDSTGVSGTNANYQPYITVYMWKRTA